MLLCTTYPATIYDGDALALTLEEAGFLPIVALAVQHRELAEDDGEALEAFLAETKRKERAERKAAKHEKELLRQYQVSASVKKGKGRISRISMGRNLMNGPWSTRKKRDLEHNYHGRPWQTNSSNRFVPGMCNQLLDMRTTGALDHR